MGSDYIQLELSGGQVPKEVENLWNLSIIQFLPGTACVETEEFLENGTI
jgi:cyclophilin family peptidyl-prolyl cis-trans isomerase